MLYNLSDVMASLTLHICHLYFKMVTKSVTGFKLYGNKLEVIINWCCIFFGSDRIVDVELVGVLCYTCTSTCNKWRMFFIQLPNLYIYFP